MGNNSSVYDREKTTKSKSTKQLQSELKKFEDAVDNWNSEGLTKSPPAMYNDYIQYLRMKIGERIGKTVSR